MTGVDNSGQDSGTLSCRKFHVSGRVQGVFFRASTQTAARDLGITGHAVNLPDGSVEVLACGSLAALDELATWLKAGPPLAQVTNIAVATLEYRELDDFRTG